VTGGATEDAASNDDAGDQQRGEGAPQPDASLTLIDEIGLKMLSFFVIVFIMIGCARFLNCNVFGLECDDGYTLQLFFRQDFHKVVLDLVFLFLVGRLSTSSCLPINSAAFVAIVLIGAIAPSWWTGISFMHHSVSLYDMSCNWTAGTWITMIFVLGVIATIGALHIRSFISSTTQAEKMRAVAEGAVLVSIFLLPRIFESGFHMHHWYTMWFLALTCRCPTLWSRGTQAFLIGGYINGVAVYGRDPVLACQAAYDLAYGQQCMFLTHCTVETAAGPAPTTYTPPDWRGCRAGDYA
jgi:hypothetical protein